MLDVKAIRQDPAAISAALAKRGVTVDFSAFLKDDAACRQSLAAVQEKKATRNAISGTVAAKKKAGEDTAAIFEEMRRLGDEIKAEDQAIAALEEGMRAFLLGLPNLPADDVQAGGKEQNRVIKHWGEKPVLPEGHKNHVDLATDLGLVDYARGAKLAGNGYWLYTGQGALLEWALVQFFIATHLADGWQFILPPHQLGYACGLTAGQFPKFADEVYWINSQSPAPDAAFMLPTAETALVNLHREEILDAEQLPLRYIAYTPCYRREAGSYRAEERGMIRGHQFNKVEMVAYTTPEQSEALFEEMVGRAAMLVERLGLHHRVVALAAGDVSASMRKTHDIEIWIPSMNGYKEVSSASSAGDYQARRGSMRYRAPDGKPAYLHTLNASGLATSRIFPAILEQYQLPDGRVRVPDALVPYMGCEILG